MSSQSVPAPLTPVEPGVTAFLDGPIGAQIGGEVVINTNFPSLPVIDPGSDTTIAEVSCAGGHEVARAVDAAQLALPAWRRLSPSRRERALHRLADAVETHAEELAQLETLDTGKPLAAARGEVAAAIACFRYYAGWPTKLHGTTNPAPAGFHSYTTREPVGVCGLITAWNYPFMLAAWKLAPALATGNTVVLKAPEQTPLSSLRLGRLCQEAGLPPGVVNVVVGHGDIAGQALVEHPDVAKVSFTGSTRIGQHITATSAASLKRLTLELGGKSPTIVLADADLDAAAAGAAQGIFWNAGQVCTAGSRLLVERSIADEVVERVADHARRLRPGHGLDPESTLGPMVSAEHRARVQDHIDSALDAGATAALQLPTPDLPGYFVGPTILTDLAPGAAILREEVFGPVLAVVPFDADDDLAALANATDYGLAASVWTRDVARAHTVARAVEAGTVWVNTFGVIDPSGPFGGYKQSGVGRELGAGAIEAFTETKTVYISLA